MATRSARARAMLPSMRARLSSSIPGLGLAVGVGVAAVLAAGCAFRPSGGAAGEPDDDDVTTDAPAPVVDARPPVDAGDDPVLDAGPGFDLDACPSSYLSVLNAPSRYRIINPLSWASAEATCQGHSSGLTHLVVFSGQGERDAVGAAVIVTGDFRRMWIGVWNGGDGARTVTGEPVYPDTALEASEAVSWIRSLTTPFRADPLTTPFAALCECDGRPATP